MAKVSLTDRDRFVIDVVKRFNARGITPAQTQVLAVVRTKYPTTLQPNLSLRLSVLRHAGFLAGIFYQYRKEHTRKTWGACTPIAELSPEKQEAMRARWREKYKRRANKRSTTNLEGTTNDPTNTHKNIPENRRDQVSANC